MMTPTPTVMAMAMATPAAAATPTATGKRLCFGKPIGLANKRAPANAEPFVKHRARLKQQQQPNEPLNSTSSTTQPPNHPLKQNNKMGSCCSKDLDDKRSWSPEETKNGVSYLQKRFKIK